jgi:hypothetical protein
MAGRSTALVLQARLTAHGLSRTLARQDVSPQFVREVSVEEAARQLQRQLTPRGASPPKASRKKNTAYAPRAKKTKKATKSAVHTVQPNYWRRVKHELHLLICTDDKKYAPLRKHLGKEGRVSQIAIVSSISAGIGVYIGISATVLGPFVTLGLMALLQVGTNAWCAGQFE